MNNTLDLIDRLPAGEGLFCYDGDNDAFLVSDTDLTTDDLKELAARVHELEAANERLLRVISDVFKERGEVWLGNILAEHGWESNWSKLNGVEPLEGE